MSNDSVKRILVLAANPKNTSRLRLDEEVREISEGLTRSKMRDHFELIQKWAIRPRDIQRAILEVSPNIIHFSGHGAGEEGLALEDETGQAKFVPTGALAGLFELFATEIECVLLNACYSEVQAEAISQHIPFVIGMSHAVEDKAALEFAVSFYDALGAGKSIEFAYKLGCNAIHMTGIREHLTPILKRIPTSDALVVSSGHCKEGKEDESKLVFALEEPGGAVPSDSPFYIERPPIESICYRVIEEPGAILRIESPRLMGKSSLLYKVLEYANKRDYQVIFLNFQMVDSDFLSSTDLFLQWFCAIVADKLNLEDKLSDYWIVSSKSSYSACTKYFEKYLIPACTSSLVIGIDEVDQVCFHPQIAKSFFGLLQTWHEMSKTIEIWRKLKVVTVGAKDVDALLILNDALPFDAAKTVRLLGFKNSQVHALAQRHQLNWSTKQIEQIMNMLGGHPYLTRLALYEIASGSLTPESLCEVAHTEDGPFYSVLRRHLLNLESHPNLMEAIKQLITADSVKLKPTQAFQLQQMGLVKLQDGSTSILCDTYRKFFLEHL